MLLAAAFYCVYYFGSPNTHHVPLPPPVVNKIVITDKEVQEVYNNLTKYTGLAQYSLPALVIDKNDGEINAYSQGFGYPIHIYSGMIKFCHSKDEIASILAHELSHVLLQHAILNPNGDNDPNYETFLEGNADKFGVYLTMRAGYNVCESKEIWARLRLINGDFETNSTHPNYSYRYWQLEFPQCVVH